MQAVSVATAVLSYAFLITVCASELIKDSYEQKKKVMRIRSGRRALASQLSGSGRLQEQFILRFSSLVWLFRYPRLRVQAVFQA